MVILFMACALLFLIHQYLQMYADFNIPFMDDYLDPLLVMPVILYAVLWERRILLKDKNITLSYTEILGYFFLMVIFGEIIFPLMSDRFIADYWDVLAYAFGTISYIIAKNYSNNAN